MRPNGVKLFRTQSPRHFEGGDWNEGGSCQRDKPLSAEEVLKLKLITYFDFCCLPLHYFLFFTFSFMLSLTS